MVKDQVITLHVRDAVSKTFHISADRIILHVDVHDTPIMVPEKYRRVLMQMAESGKRQADAIVEMVDINVHADVGDGSLGVDAQRIWEESIS